jgi:hypothetical protein
VGGRDVLVAHERLSSTAVAFNPSAAGRPLTFKSLSDNPRRSTDPEVEIPYEPWMLRDAETGSQWRAITGECVEGELKGERLEMLDGQAGFWFAWSRFHPGSSLLELPATPEA